jgi:hypothetical protein
LHVVFTELPRARGSDARESVHHAAALVRKR